MTASPSTKRILLRATVISQNRSNMRDYVNGEMNILLVQHTWIGNCLLEKICNYYCPQEQTITVLIHPSEEA